MKHVFNILSVLAFAAAILIGKDTFGMDTAVPTDPGQFGAVGSVANLQLMHIQLMGSIVTCALVLSGIICMGFSALLAHLQNVKTRP